MPNKKILIIIFIVISTIGFLAYNKTYKNNPATTSKSEIPTQAPTQNEPPKIVSTIPDPLNDAVIPTTQTIEITFNRPLENVGEFKLRMEPKIDYKLELSSDRKAAKIIPVKPYDLGSSYTIYIGAETKFDGVGRWGEEKTYHYRTIKYTGV